MAKEGSSNVLVDGISLHVEDHGSGKPVVLPHGCSPLSRCVTDACRSERSCCGRRVVQKEQQTAVNAKVPTIARAKEAPVLWFKQKLLSKPSINLQ